MHEIYITVDKPADLPQFKSANVDESTVLVLTGHAVSYDVAYEMAVNAVYKLAKSGVNVTRIKIENVVYDQRL